MSGLAKSRARSVADLGAGTILATVEIAASPDRVFAALTTDEVTRWWGSSITYRTTEWVGDVRPGGRWRATGVGFDGVPYSIDGEFREVDPPRKIVQTWRAPWDGGNETMVTYRLEAIEGGTRVTVRHEGFADRRASNENHADGWQRVLGWIAAYLAPAHNGGAPLYFLLKLHAPRPSFANDMSEEEAALMREHVVYWRQLCQRDTAVVFGPVADPAGTWGMGVVQVSSEADVASLRDADPVMRSGRGFRYEILPMLRAVTRD